MDLRNPPEYTLELFADRANVKDVVKGILHTIFFHRYLTSLYPASQDVLDLTLPYITEEDFEALIEQRCDVLLRQLDGGSGAGSVVQASASFYPSPSNPATTSSASPARAQVLVHFLEKKRRKSGWFVSAKADEEMLWESWTVDVMQFSAPRSEREAAQNRRQMDRSLQKALMAILTIVGREMSHIPPITSNDGPFPYRVTVVGPPGSRR